MPKNSGSTRGLLQSRESHWCLSPSDRQKTTLVRGVLSRSRYIRLLNCGKISCRRLCDKFTHRPSCSIKARAANTSSGCRDSHTWDHADVQRDRRGLCDCATVCPTLERRRGSATRGDGGRLKRQLELGNRPARRGWLHHHRQGHSAGRLPQPDDGTDQQQWHLFHRPHAGGQCREFSDPGRGG
jgi:hypothetical protein